MNTTTQYRNLENNQISRGGTSNLRLSTDRSSEPIANKISNKNPLVQRQGVCDLELFDL